MSPLVGVVAACAIAGGCASSDAAVRSGPPARQLCPPSAEETMAERFDIGLLPHRRFYQSVRMPGWSKGMYWDDPVTVTEGRHEVIVYLRGHNPNVPPGLVLVGDFFLRDRLYARFVEARLPSGERVPFCGELFSEVTGEAGAPFLPGSKPGAMKVGSIQKVEAKFYDH